MISHLKKLSKICKKSNIIFYNITRGGYIPINCSDTFNNIFIFNEDIVNNHNIICNLYTHSIQNISILYECFDNSIEIVVTDTLKYIKDNKSIILTYYNGDILPTYKYYYHIKNTSYILYIPEWLYDNFYKRFNYFIKGLIIL